MQLFKTNDSWYECCVASVVVLLTNGPRQNEY